jgi:AcrR family transcriptional regulator
MNADEPRVWAGTTLDTRREARREKLLEVGLELLGGPGGAAAVTVRSVCRHAKLTDRYFYESFADRDELLVAVYDRVGAQAQQVLIDAVSREGAAIGPEGIARAAVRAFLGLLTTDPRKGRVLLLAPTTDAVLSQRALGLQPAFAELIRLQLASEPAREPADEPADEPTDEPADESAQRLTATALIGALSQLFVRWLDGSLAVSADELTDYCVRLLVHSVRLATRE